MDLESDEPFCASSPAAQRLSDDDFWAKVYDQDKEEPDDFEDYLDHQYLWPKDAEAGFDDLLEGYNIISANGERIAYIRPDNNCPVCGSTTACGYDNDGRAMIHALPETE